LLLTQYVAAFLNFLHSEAAAFDSLPKLNIRLLYSRFEVQQLHFFALAFAFSAPLR
jgi:hypothetical protein